MENVLGRGGDTRLPQVSPGISSAEITAVHHHRHVTAWPWRLHLLGLSGSGAGTDV